MEPLQPHQSRWYLRTDPQGRALLALLLPLAGVYLCQLVTLQEPAAAWAWMGSHAGAAGYPPDTKYGSAHRNPKASP